MLAALGQVNEISQGLSGGWAYVTGLLVVAVMGEFAVLMAQHRAQLKDRDAHQAAIDEVQEARMQDALRVLPVLERVSMAVMVLDRTIDVLQSLTDFQRGAQTVVTRRPKTGGGSDER